MTNPPAVYSGLMPDGSEVLITCWPDQADLAFRDMAARTWQPPIYVQRVDSDGQ